MEGATRPGAIIQWRIQGREDYDEHGGARGCEYSEGTKAVAGKEELGAGLEEFTKGMWRDFGLAAVSIQGEERAARGCSGKANEKGLEKGKIIQEKKRRTRLFGDDCTKMEGMGD
ncbi:unnamed protein product [Calypogeia fissa]